MEWNETEWKEHIYIQITVHFTRTHTFKQITTTTKKTRKKLNNYFGRFVLFMSIFLRGSTWSFSLSLSRILYMYSFILPPAYIYKINHTVATGFILHICEWWWDTGRKKTQSRVLLLKKHPHHLKREREGKRRKNTQTVALGTLYSKWIYIKCHNIIVIFHTYFSFSSIHIYQREHV